MNGIKVQISDGQFSGEFAVTGMDANGEEFSLFVQERDLDLKKCILRVEPVVEEGDLVLVQLPNGTLENGNTFTVRRNELILMDAGKCA